MLSNGCSQRSWQLKIISSEPGKGKSKNVDMPSIGLCMKNEFRNKLAIKERAITDNFQSYSINLMAFHFTLVIVVTAK